MPCTRAACITRSTTGCCPLRRQPSIFACACYLPAAGPRPSWRCDRRTPTRSSFPSRASRMAPFFRLRCSKRGVCTAPTIAVSFRHGGCIRCCTWYVLRVLLLGRSYTRTHMRFVPRRKANPVCLLDIGERHAGRDARSSREHSLVHDRRVDLHAHRVAAVQSTNDVEHARPSCGNQHSVRS